MGKTILKRETRMGQGAPPMPVVPSTAGQHAVLAACLLCRGVGGPQWVRFASPQLAPTAPATTVFIALSSECHLVFIEFSVDCSSAGVWVQGPFLPLPQIGIAVACGAVGLQTCVGGGGG